MAKIVSSHAIMAVTAEEVSVSEDFYPLFSYLRDACTPDVRSLFNWFQDYYDDNLQAGALVKHTLDDGRNVHELFIMYDNTLLSFQPQGRFNGSQDDFINLVISRSHMER